MANRVLCSTLAIPIPPTRYSIDQLLESNDAEKRRRLASLLSLSSVPTPPTRATLVKDLVGRSILATAVFLFLMLTILALCNSSSTTCTSLTDLLVTVELKAIVPTNAF